ncbi:MAG: hypothetical protein ACOX4I_05305 [Anaerovoracaceae bacterium]|jgi:hypothetical protein
MTRNTRGYYTVEAAIFLSIFIITVLTIGYFIKVAGAQEDVMHAAADEGRLAAAYAYNVKAMPAFPRRLENRIADDNRDISFIDVNGFRYLHDMEGNEGMISFDMAYRVDIHLPLKMKKTIEKKDRLLLRGWIGRSREGAPMSFDDMMKDEDGGDVWVFPHSGHRYHKRDCTFVSNYPTQMVLTDSIRRHYKACEKCHPGGMATGSLIYCFPDYGEVYHRGGCKTIDKYTVKMSRQQAEERGYTPCAKCGGI